MRKCTSVLFWTAVIVIAGLQQPYSGYGMQQPISVGKTFPDIHLNAPENPEALSYLGLEQDSPFTIRDVQADLVLVELLNVYCSHCQQQASSYNRLFELLASDKTMADRVKMLGVAVGNNDAEIKTFREKYEVRFPIVPDKRFELFHAVGGRGTPLTFLVRLPEKSDTPVVVLTHSGVNEDIDKMYQDMNALKSLDIAALQEKGAHAEGASQAIEPPMPLPEILAQVKSSMTNLVDGQLLTFQELALENRRIYRGVIESEGGKAPLFVEVVARPTICDVCHDVHFYYIFSQEGEILDFGPLKLTKWKNAPWSTEDVQFMRDRLTGKFIYESFEFQPDVDAVTSATITSAVIFNAMSNGQAVFEFLKEKNYIR